MINNLNNIEDRNNWGKLQVLVHQLVDLMISIFKTFMQYQISGIITLNIFVLIK